MLVWQRLIPGITRTQVSLLQPPCSSSPQWTENILYIHTVYSYPFINFMCYMDEGHEITSQCINSACLSPSVHILLLQHHQKNVTFEVLLPAPSTITFFCNVTPCSLADMRWHFRGFIYLDDLSNRFPLDNNTNYPSTWNHIAGDGNIYWTDNDILNWGIYV
jgi:hypothetical protein